MSDVSVSCGAGRQGAGGKKKRRKPSFRPVPRLFPGLRHTLRGRRHTRSVGHRRRLGTYSPLARPVFLRRFGSERVGQECGGVHKREVCLPPAEYLPAFIAVHALLILAPHYIWLNVFGASLDSFSHLVSGLSRTRDPNTGDYPENNCVISRQLDAFTSGAYRSNSMYKFYLVKLIVQVFFSVGGLLLVFASFRDFNDSFSCPSNSEDTMSDDWPLTGERVKCVFTSLRLLQKIWFMYLILLIIATICLTVSFLILLFTDHTKELGLKEVSAFFFQTSLQFEHYTPRLTIREKLSHVFLALFPCMRSADSSIYRIRTDYDFLLVKLFRTDGGLAQVLREVHLLRLLKDLNNEELASVSSHITNTTKKSLGKKGV